jgi:hypothetical protein
MRERHNLLRPRDFQSMMLLLPKGASMELEIWAGLVEAIDRHAETLPSRPRDTHATATIVRVHLWAASHDRPTIWACAKKNWAGAKEPEVLPDQSTMSRRTRRRDFHDFLHQLYPLIKGPVEPRLLKVVDGKALELPNHSTDPDARWGRGVSRQSIGYKLHMICSENPLPDAFVITALNVCEKQMAHRMIGRIGGHGYLLGDAHFDASWLFDACRFQQHQLVCPRAKPGTQLGHHYQSPARIRSIQMLESPAGVNDFGQRLYRQRTTIERRFSHAVFSAGLHTLPPWVRRIGRVRNWVQAKLIILAVRVTKGLKNVA